METGVGTCSVCGQRVGTTNGNANYHQLPGSRETCPGTGRPAN